MRMLLVRRKRRLGTRTSSAFVILSLVYLSDVHESRVEDILAPNRNKDSLKVKSWLVLWHSKACHARYNLREPGPTNPAPRPELRLHLSHFSAYHEVNLPHWGSSEEHHL